MPAPAAKPATVKVLSTPPSREFPQEWYALATPENFWMRWRLRAFQSLLAGLGIPSGQPWRVLDIGCGNGTLRSQVEAATSWSVDGADIDRGSLEMSPALRGESLLYDVDDRRPELRERYDALLVFDVIEHIADVRSFLDACLYHLKPGGWLFVNVPALQAMRSRYDDAAGHLRRYDRGSLGGELQRLGLEGAALRYWGLSMLPLLAARKLVLLATPPEKVISRGFAPPGRLAERALAALMGIETRLLKAPPLGTSLLAAARKPCPNGR